MSITAISVPDKIHKKSFHRRHDSGELDVFEAARYFSGAATDFYNHNTTTSTFTNDHHNHNHHQKTIKESWRGGRISLDMPSLRNSIPPSETLTTTTSFSDQKLGKEKKYKQPISPGGRLANFLNSLFNQTSAKKKKSSKSGTQSAKEEDESPGGWRRKRRSSISHFRSSSAVDPSSKSIYSSSSSGFRTPPPYSILATNNSTTKKGNDEQYKTNTGGGYDWREEKLNLSANTFSVKLMDTDNGFLEKMKDVKGIKNEFLEVDEGMESDSSSDLFELENYDLGYGSSGLPVYETTRLDHIKKMGAPISSGGAM